MLYLNEIWMSKGLNCRYEPNVHSLRFGSAEYGFGTAKFDSLSILSNEIALCMRNCDEYTLSLSCPNV